MLDNLNVKVDKLANNDYKTTYTVNGKTIIIKTFTADSNQKLFCEIFDGLSIISKVNK